MPFPLFYRDAAQISLLFIESTVELQWLKHLWDHENMFETGIVRARECLSERQVRRHNRDIFSIVYTMKAYCVFSLDDVYV